MLRAAADFFLIKAENKMTDTGAPQPPAAPPPQQPQAPSLRVLAQYIKDLSFENPGIQAQNEQMSTDLGIDVKATPHAQGNGIFEVSIKLTACLLYTSPSPRDA